MSLYHLNVRIVSSLGICCCMTSHMATLSYHCTIVTLCTCVTSIVTGLEQVELTCDGERKYSANIYQLRGRSYKMLPARNCSLSIISSDLLLPADRSPGPTTKIGGLIGDQISVVMIRYSAELSSLQSPR